MRTLCLPIGLPAPLPSSSPAAAAGNKIVRFSLVFLYVRHTRRGMRSERYGTNRGTRSHDFLATSFLTTRRTERRRRAPPENLLGSRNARDGRNDENVIDPLHFCTVRTFLIAGERSPASGKLRAARSPRSRDDRDGRARSRLSGERISVSIFSFFPPSPSSSARPSEKRNAAFAPRLM